VQRPPLENVSRLLALEIAEVYSKGKSSMLARSKRLCESSIMSLKAALEKAGLSVPDLTASSTQFEHSSTNKEHIDPERSTWTIAEMSGEPEILWEAADEMMEDSGGSMRWMINFLFGDLIECQMPFGWVKDTSVPEDELPEPDKDEIWQDEDHGYLVKVGLRRLLKSVDDNDVAHRLFRDVCETLGLDEEGRKFRTIEDSDIDIANLPPESKVLLAKGSSFVEDECGFPVSMSIELCVIRIPSTETELFVISTSPVLGEVKNDDGCLTDAFSHFVGSFHAEDWGRVSWQPGKEEGMEDEVAIIGSPVPAVIATDNPKLLAHS